MSDKNSIRTWTLGATTGLVLGALMGGILAAATASSTAPCGPAAEAVTAARSAPAAPSHVAQSAPARPTRWVDRSTQYASGDHLWFSWRSSMVRWLGGQPVPTVKEQHVATQEGWWGETVNTPTSSVAYVASDH